MESLPHNLEAERSLVGLTLLEKRIPQGARDVAITEFYNQTWRASWRAFLELDADGAEIEPFAAFDIMKRDSPHLIERFSIRDLAAATDGQVLGFNEKVFVNKLKDHSARRYAIRELQKCIELVTSGDKDAVKILKTRVQEIEAVSDSRGNFRHISEIIDKEVVPGIRDLEKGVSHKIKTGWPALDKLIGGGLSLSDIVLVAALPGQGKSAFVLQLATQLAQQGLGVGFVAGEMSDKENCYRLVSQISNSYNLNSVDHLDPIEAQFLTEWAQNIRDLPLYFDSRTSDIQTISRSLRHLVEDCGVKILVVDYIQLFKLNKFEKLDRYNRITEVSQEVKRLAMEYSIAVIEVAQFTKDGMKSGHKAKLSDLENGTQLIKDISLGLILDRTPDSGINLRIEKGRNSGEAELAGKFYGPKLRFEF